LLCAQAVATEESEQHPSISDYGSQVTWRCCLR
jgi:hypothetical protein